MKEILKNSFLFRNIDEGMLLKIIDENPPEIKTYKRGDLIYPIDSELCAVGFVIQGKCEVRTACSDSTKTILNILSVGDSFGIISVFSDEEFPTEIYASVSSVVLFFSKAQIAEFVNNYSQISTNIIKFLADRVSFLNRKIATFSAKSVESKLAAFILHESARQASEIISFNAKKTSEEIGAGRASVYRALSSLENSGAILFTSKQIQIINKSDLERM